MAEAVPPQGSECYVPVASYWHLVIVLVAQGAIIYRGILRALQAHAVAPNRITIYQRTMLFEWLMLGLVLIGVWWHGSSLLSVLGDRWRSLGRFFRDLGIAVLFLIVTIGIGSMIQSLLGQVDNPAARHILPQGGIEAWYWVALSITAGICEEALYRGYLQRQFIALTKSVPLGIFLPAILFGVAHSYQGFRHAVPIGILGALGGILAYWCKSVRPGMIAHALQDVLGGLAHH